MKSSLYMFPVTSYSKLLYSTLKSYHFQGKIIVVHDSSEDTVLHNRIMDIIQENFITNYLAYNISDFHTDLEHHVLNIISITNMRKIIIVTMHTKGSIKLTKQLQKHVSDPETIILHMSDGAFNILRYNNSMSLSIADYPPKTKISIEVTKLFKDAVRQNYILSHFESMAIMSYYQFKDEIIQIINDNEKIYDQFPGKISIKNNMLHTVVTSFKINFDVFSFIGTKNDFDENFFIISNYTIGFFVPEEKYADAGLKLAVYRINSKYNDLKITIKSIYNSSEDSLLNNFKQSIDSGIRVFFGLNSYLFNSIILLS